MASTLLHDSKQPPRIQRQQPLPQQLQEEPQQLQTHGRQHRRATVHADRDLLTVGRAFQPDSTGRQRHCRRAARTGSGSSGEGIVADEGESLDDEFDLFCRLAHSPTGLGSSPRQSSSPRQPDCLLSAVHWAAVPDSEQRSGRVSASPREDPQSSDWIANGGLRQVDEEGASSCEPDTETSDESAAALHRGSSSRHRQKSDWQQHRESAAPTAIIASSGTATTSGTGSSCRPRACSTGMAGLSGGGIGGRDRRPNHSSVKERRSDFRQQQDQLELPAQQQQQQQILRVRSFRRTKHGLVNQGDAVVTGRSNSSLNASSAASSDQELRAAHQAAAAAAAVAAAAAAERRRSSGGASGGSSGLAAAAAVDVRGLCSGGLPDHPCQSYRVQVMGAPRVGKSTLCSQFMSSENQVLNAAADEDILDESIERFVTVLLDADEYHMTFLDTDKVDDPMSTIVMDVDAYMIVFAVDNRRSFGFAKQVFNELVSEARKSSALILVANKSDLVRNRDVTHEEAKNLASVYGAKYIEISTALNHNVDELLVSILSQIKAQQKKIEKEKCKLLSREKDGARGLRASLRLRSPRQALGNFIRKHFSSKSCEDLEPKQA